MVEEKPTLLNYVYNNLKEQIMSGQIRPGGRLPSMRGLCEEYGVSIRTMIDVLARLKREGLIEQQPRQAATVCVRDQKDGPHAATLEVLARREELPQILHTLSLLYPSIMAFCSQNCQLEKLPHYKQAMKADGIESAGIGWRAVTALFRDVMSSSGNPLFSEVYSLFSNYSWFSYFVDKQDSVDSNIQWDAFLQPSQLIRLLKKPDPKEACRQLAALYERKEWEIGKSLDYLIAHCDHLPELAKPAFTWDSKRGRDHFFMRIEHDLIGKIGFGIYPPGSYLPPEDVLAKEYGVCKGTLRRALADMAMLGFCKTYNVKGTVVTLPDPDTISVSLKDQTVHKAYTLNFLHTLQFMAFAIQPAAHLAAPNITEEDIRALYQKFEDPNLVAVGEIIKCIHSRLELRPLQVVLGELIKLTRWGYFFAFYRSTLYSTNYINQLCRDSLRCLENGDVDCFANKLMECYFKIFHTVQNFVIERFDLQEAVGIRSPQPFLQALLGIKDDEPSCGPSGSGV